MTVTLSLTWTLKLRSSLVANVWKTHLYIISSAFYVPMFFDKGTNWSSWSGNRDEENC